MDTLYLIRLCTRDLPPAWHQIHPAVFSNDQRGFIFTSAAPSPWIPIYSSRRRTLATIHPAAMICQRCRRTGILSRFLQQPQQALRSAAPPTPTPTLTPRYQIPTLQQRAQTRAYSDGKPSVAPPPPSAPRQPVSDDVSIPSAISSATPGISQPLSTAGGVHAEVRPDQPTAAEQRVPSTCPVGMKMGGLSYEKNKPEIFALEDSEYPDWLWGLLKEFEEKEKADKGGVDPSSMSMFHFLDFGYMCGRLLAC